MTPVKSGAQTERSTRIGRRVGWSDTPRRGGGGGGGGSRGDGAIMEAEERKHSEGAREEIETAVTLQVSGREAGKVGCR